MMNFPEFIERNLSVINIEKILDNEGICIAIFINFSENYSLFFQIDIDTDEIHVHALKNQLKNQYIMEYKNNAIKCEIIDFSVYFLLRGWIMKNNFGYQDAVQLELWNEIQKESLFIQIQSIASNLEIYKLASFD